MRALSVRPSLGLVLGLSVFAAACDTSSLNAMTDPTDDADTNDTPDLLVVAPVPDLGDNGAPSDTYPADFPAAPQVVTGNGPVLQHPRIVPVFFMGDDATMVMQISDFLKRVGATAYWKAVTSEYGVFAATSTDPVMLTEAAPTTITDAQIQTWLAGKLNAGDPLWPVADRNTVYALHYPASTTITLPSGGGGAGSTSCTSFGGYHDSITANDVNKKKINVAYAVVPRCADFGNLTGIDAVTGAESHELIEAATDPYPMAQGAYAQVDDDHFYWQLFLGGGEVGDMCAQTPGVFTQFAELPYTVQRTWSNEAAAAGHNPCVPAPAGVTYFAGVPELNDSVSLFGGISSLGVNIPVGSSETVDIDLFSDGATSPFTVKVVDVASLTGGKANLGFVLDRNKGQNGEKLHVTITSKTASHYGVTGFVVEASLGNVTNTWLGLVNQM